MGNVSDAGRLLMVLGGVLFVVGGLLAAGGVPWLGRLPGDLMFRRGPVTVYLPIATCLLLSAALTLGFWLLRR